LNRRGAQTAIAAAAALAALAAIAPSGATAKLARPGEPVTLTGDVLERLQGADPSRLVGFRVRAGNWEQVPVQIDERKTVDFGQPPGGSGAGGGRDGTVYGTAASGYTALQYADPGTFVGADPDGSFDADDELTFMAGDTGDRARHKDGRPRGVSRKRATRIRVGDPRRPLAADKKLAYLYVFRSRGGLDPSAGKDYVSYDFDLDSGAYKPTYRRGSGPNPEHSKIATGTYEIGFSDRWYYDELRLKPPGGSGADILDGFKFGFGAGSCGRSEATFNAGEGAFVANIDGPVRAIRSYVGANSGPRTERTHFFYGDRHEIVTDLRVHSVPGPLIYTDLSGAAAGMTFRASNTPAVTVDGAPDPPLGGDLPPAEWQLWSGDQGSLFAADRFTSSFGDDLEAGGYGFYLDDSTPPFEQCWGDSAAIGQYGYGSTSSMPNTDPALGDFETLRSTTTEILAGHDTGARKATAWARQIDTPLGVSAAPFQAG
jgi:hypothetical protein